MSRRCIGVSLVARRPRQAESASEFRPCGSSGLSDYSHRFDTPTVIARPDWMRNVAAIV